MRRSREIAQYSSPSQFVYARTTARYARHRSSPSRAGPTCCWESPRRAGRPGPPSNAARRVRHRGVVHLTSKGCHVRWAAGPDSRRHRDRRCPSMRMGRRRPELDRRFALSLCCPACFATAFVANLQVTVARDQARAPDAARVALLFAASRFYIARRRAADPGGAMADFSAR